MSQRESKKEEKKFEPEEVNSQLKGQEPEIEWNPNWIFPEDVPDRIMHQMYKK